MEQSSDLRILIVGAGATGGFFGGRLIEAGRDVTFLVREQRATTIRKRGLEIMTPRGNFVVHPQLLTREDLREQGKHFDLVVLATKAYQLEAAMEDIAPAVGSQTMIPPILNGMRHLSVLDERFGSQHVLGGFTKIFSEDPLIERKTDKREKQKHGNFHIL